MKTTALSLIVLLSIFVYLGSSSQCNDPNYAIPTTNWGSTFDLSPSSILADNNLVNLIANPVASNIQNYALSIAAVSAPLWIFAGLTFIIFIVMICQVVLFDFVGIKACGRQINAGTYNPLSVRVVTAIFLVVSTTAFLGSIAALVLNSQLFVAINNSQCNAQNIIYQLYNGNNGMASNTNGVNSGNNDKIGNNVNNGNSGMPWSGVNNFTPMVQQLGVGLQNSVPFLANYFSKDGNNDYRQLTNISSNSLYGLAITFDCQQSNVTLSCPFYNATMCPDPLLATFNENFCNSSNLSSTDNGAQSAIDMINNQMINNQTTWLAAIKIISLTLQDMDISNEAINNLTTTYSQIGTNITNYQNDVQDAFNSSQNATLGMQIALYVFYSLIVIFTAGSFIMVVSIYFFKFFKCRYLTYVLWGIYMICGVVIFCISAVSLSFYLSEYNICSAYSYAFSSQANFNTIPFPNNDITQTLSSCYFQNGTSVFRVLSDTPLSTDIIILTDAFQASQPSSSFSSVVSQIQANLINYYAYPDQVSFVDQTNTSSPGYALQLANQFANFSNPNSTQLCNVTQDFIVFDPTDCGILPILNQPPNPSCVPIAQNITSRIDAFLNISITQCDNQADEYQNNFISLQNYVISVQNMVNSMISVTTNGTNPLNVYENHYFNYWSSMMNYINNDIILLFDTFYTPYLTLDNGASCSFITSSINSLYQYSCNMTYRPLEAFMIINIILGCLMMILMIFAYFLTSRYEFYEYIEGDYINSGAIGMDSRPSQVNRTLQMRNTNDWKDKQLISNRSNL